ncbi:MBG domain-containing protein, partial [Salinimicrobium marinum]|uniref:MBG domain-containing protein n=1 Tax=Salinimicrobium marinum TaxID=680283 RepID=UPI00167B9DB7
TYQITSGALVGNDSFTGSLTREVGEDVGAYAIEQGSLVLSSNYDLTYQAADFTITKAEAIITAETVQSFTYDGTVKNVAASLNHSETPLTYTPQQGYTNAGTYHVTISAEASKNYEAASEQVSLVIENAEIKEVAFDDATFTYDGSTYRLAVTGLPEGAIVVYGNNDKINAGTYTVTATISKDNYNDKVMTADLVIQKAEAVITAQAEQIFTYDGTVKNVAASLNHSETALIYAPQQGYTNAGTYPVTISAEATSNYKAASEQVALVIENAEIEGVAFDDAAFTYDGSTHKLAVSGLPKGATVVYENNDKTNAGSYTVTATISQDNHNDKVLTADLVIDKARAVITAEVVQAFIYDGTVKDITASLNHSETALTYAPVKGRIDEGRYIISIASAETDNFMAALKEVSLVIQPAEITGVTFEDNTKFVYDGKAHSIFVSGLPEGATVKYENNGRTNAGTYTVTATVSKKNNNNKVLTAKLVVNKAPQSLTFDELADIDLRNNDYLMLDAKASSGLPVSYSYSYDSENPAATVSERGFVKLLEAGQITISANQPGNQNYKAAAPVTQTLKVRGSQAGLNKVLINGSTYSNPSGEIFYLIGCGSFENEVKIQLEPKNGSTVDDEASFTIPTPNPGIYTRTVTVTAEDGNTSRSYNIKIEKTFNFEDIVIQKFNNVLLVNNNPETNGGYKFVKYEWYKNDSYVGSGQYFSEGPGAGDQLDPNSNFYVVMTTEEGEVLRTCSTSIQLKSSYQVFLTPNPVDAGGQLKLHADFPEEELESMEISLHTLNGNVLEQIKSSNKITTIQISSRMQAGVYILICKTKTRTKSLKFIVK